MRGPSTPLRYAQDFGSRLPLRSRLLNASSSIPTRSTNSLKPIKARGRKSSHEGSFDSAALRSGFRQQAPASLTPAKRLKFDPDQVHQFSKTDKSARAQIIA